MTLKHLLTAALLGGCVMSGPHASHARPAESVVEELFAAFNRHDAAGMAALYAEDSVHISPSLCEPRHGPSQITAIYRELFAALPDVHDEIQMIVTEGDTVALTFIGRSATTGFRKEIAAFIEVRGGRIVREQTFYDTGGRVCE